MGLHRASGVDSVNCREGLKTVYQLYSDQFMITGETNLDKGFQRNNTAGCSHIEAEKQQRGSDDQYEHCSFQTMTTETKELR